MKRSEEVKENRGNVVSTTVGDDTSAYTYDDDGRLIYSSDTEMVEARYVVIKDAESSLSVSGISAKCRATLETKSSKSLKIKMELQKKKSTGYETLQTWTASKTGTSLSMDESRNINLLCSYRLKTTFTAGSETEVKYKYYN